MEVNIKAKIGAGLAATVLLVTLPATAVSAARLYDDINFGSLMETRTNGTVGAGVNDKTSSVRNSGTETYCENVGCTGRKVTLNGDYNNLGSVTTNLNFGETWSDRISALQ